MISDDVAKEIAIGWIREYSVEPYVVKDRLGEFWQRLDDLIYHQPEDAIAVFKRIAEEDLSDWTFEGVAAGPIRTFIMLHEGHFDAKTKQMIDSDQTFQELINLAAEGIERE